MRAISTAAEAVLEGDVVPMTVLVELDLTSPLRLASSAMTVYVPDESPPSEFVGAGSLGAIDEVKDAPGDFSPLRLTLSGVPSDMVSLALSEPIRDKACTISLAIIDPADSKTVVDAPVYWSGTLDTISTKQEGATAAISVTAEHAGALYARPKPLRYTDADQQRLYPGDTSCRFSISQSQHPDVWPAAAFFAK